ncbi:MAG: GntR family transcriptional regulator [Leucobacter sp.]
MSVSTPLHMQLYDEMVHRIRTGAWKAGAKVPSERALITEFGTSRGPVRQALAALRAEGMIVGGRGTPPRVQRTAPPQSFDTFMSFTEWAKELGLTPGQKIIEASRRYATEDAARELRVPHDSTVVEIIRLRFLGDEPTMLERSLFPYEIGRHLLAADLDRGSIYQALREANVIPVRARHVIDAIAAHPLEVETLRVGPEAPLLRVRRTAYSSLGGVIEVADDRYLPTMASFIVENTTDHRSPLVREAAGRGAEVFTNY